MIGICEEDPASDAATPCSTAAINAICRASAGPCDEPERCSLFEPDCPEDGYDPDWDSDGVPDICDNCRSLANPAQEDGDGDGQGDVCDRDNDGDLILDLFDNCPGVPNRDQKDRDDDWIGDACDPCPDGPNDDTDGDGILDCTDNCPRRPNPDQGETDGDGVGDVCDVCPAAADPAQADLEGDGIGDRCDEDQDGDGVENEIDNCPSAPNRRQVDADHDSVGDRCDNCPLLPNVDQSDGDGDGFGDSCQFEIFAPWDGHRYDDHEPGWRLAIRGRYAGLPASGVKLMLDGKRIHPTLLHGEIAANVPLGQGSHELVATITTAVGTKTIRREFTVFPRVGSVEHLASTPRRQILLPATRAHAGIRVLDLRGKPAQAVPVAIRIWDQDRRSTVIEATTGSRLTIDSFSHPGGWELGLTVKEARGTAGELRVVFAMPKMNDSLALEFRANDTVVRFDFLSAQR